jgi:hypothetical protein
MSITAHRATLTAAGAAVLASVPAPAQADPNTVLDILAECLKIGDVMARVACYDNTVRSARGTAAATPSGQGGIPQDDRVPIAAGGALDAGRESTRSRRFAAAPLGEAARSTPTVAAVAERRPGAYLLTLADGAQWEFAEDMPLSYLAPRQGLTVEIERGALGNYRMRFDGQQPVRVRRVR